ncbi:hypothetical protein P8625_14155 [Tenacibaculum tangerinum]|uniref:Uncharacterized protein n=1 Tax=Tenacibaculum tangerinum TaxID=3038772 RepID=A0ABY8L1M9_9FLAO|nr:hypothetical protein [Tenacibaculum tangerinum]WGH75199.1 hypothetical protein P8625_14155 [Tenacibaculum tangerinum]
MENVFKYYEFSAFFKDNSGTFQGDEISFSELNEQHFLIFEKNKSTYNLYISKYTSKEYIGKEPPEILELLVSNYDKSIPEHRIILKKYLY